MSEIIASTQTQAITSELVILYDLEYADGYFARFSPMGLEADLSTIEFRDSSGTAREYTAIPMEAEGFDISADGSYNRPTLSIANLESTFSDAIPGLQYEDLIGRRITRRTTLKKYLVGESGDSGAGNAPVEFPKIVYVIDRIKEKNPLSVTFELAAPFDLAGITLPRRVIVANTCPFKYKGAKSTLNPLDKRGGCDWEATISGTSTAVYMSKNDEYVVPDTITFTTFSSSATAGNYYKTTNSSVSVITATNTKQTQAAAGITVYNYWQALEDTSVTPSDSSLVWRRVRIYDAYSSSVTYYGFTDKRFNQYILESGVLWQVKHTTETGSSHNTRAEGAYWTQGDVCAKKLKSCALRFQAKVHGSITGGVAVSKDSNIPLPFGGFPGSVVKR